jgi:hypothetical protein
MKKRALQESTSPPARREPRIQHLTELHLTYEGDVGEVPIRPPDLSLHGMFVNTSTHFPEGAILKVRFRLTQLNLEVQTRGEVRYCLPGIGIGVEFVALGAEASRAIEKVLRAFSRPPHPKRKLGPRQGS